jgi:16S rRNA (guanine527-N7)-methyltransferase
MSDFLECLREYAPSFGLDVDETISRKLERHFDLLVRWNSKVNLTRISSVSGAVRFHYVESLWVDRFAGAGERFVDVGSGAGFPGIPLALVRPETPFVLLEPNVKKATFLRECGRSLDLGNVTVRPGRFQETDVLRSDVIVTRAVEQLETVLPLLLESVAGRVVVLSSRDVLASADPFDRNTVLVPVPLAENRVLGIFDRES